MQQPAGALLQGDGNFVAYDENGLVYDASHTEGNPGAFLNIQSDGNIVIYTSGNVAIWTPSCNLLQPRYPLPPGGCP